ncbi:MAG: redoxin domain-containing protein [Gammaproteobacteria bacterium]|jgi:peroxiredoxin|nr:redoxin domain-containing protein [Gammaproteobacteria bacterium]MDH3846293.1 redoxin domain-containing protein [Gammaproteobacteria bacterium]MDH3864419.1 redoxin domain-containing protein [Gammaproteobacteria bacterium]MDH4004213.1 redoxin domain-containing protein [Gammaproteobacteria bacterium]NCF58647.1 redoxin domain-containing protein [Gammaproteobacteria bacterium]
MAFSIARQRTIKKMLLGLFAVTMAMSLACSLSIQHGHADVPVAASADEIRPLSAGRDAPRFTVETVDGEPFHFEPRGLERPAVLIAFRGGWCPYCNVHLSELRHVLPAIQAMGVDVLFLSGDRPELLYSSLDADTQADIGGLGFTILSDAKAGAAIALGIAFRAADDTIQRRRDKGQDIDGSSMALQGVLPVPSVFAVDTDGIIRFAYSNADYTVRLPADELLAAATGIVPR